MRIALLTDGLFPFQVGGMQRYSTHLAESLFRMGVELHLFHTVRSVGKRDEALALKTFSPEFRAGVFTHFVDYPRPGTFPGHYIRDSYAYSERLLREFREKGVEVDFIYAQGQCGRAFLNAKRNGVLLPPVGVNIHGFEMFQPVADLKSYFAKRMVQRCFVTLVRKADYVFSFPGKIRTIVQTELRIPESRIIETYNGIPQGWIVGGSRRRDGITRFVFVGRYERRKGIPELLKAIASIPSESLEFHFVGPFEKRFNGVDPRLHFHGSVVVDAKLIEILDHCDVLVCPSFAEGMPTTILEAMARGLAVIATNVGAVSELVGDDNGVLLDTPSPKLIANAMRLISGMSDETIVQKKNNSILKVRRFTWNRITADLIEKIERMIQSS